MIEIKGLKKSYGTNEVLKGIDQKINDGEVLCIIGPSGGGKSTMLRCLNRLEEPTEGEIRIDGELITAENITKIRERMGMVFQSFNLFPHLSVLGNITVGPVNVKGVSKADAEQKGMALLDMVGLADKAHAKPRSLSGGQQQRVAIARALAMEPEIMLFMIVELVNSACHSAILYGEPVTLDKLKPYVYRSVNDIIERHTKGLK